MAEQRIDVNQEHIEQNIDISTISTEQAVNVGSEPSVLHGIDGVSPIATVTQTADGAIISITDRDGTTTATITNGQDGRDGADGQDGRDGRDGIDGAAATISVGSTTTGAAGSQATVTNSGTSSAAVLNFTIPRGETGATGATGAPGRDGRDGQDGQNGQDGADGFSPTATVTKSGDTATITITDRNGTTTASVSDGVNGTNGTNGQDGFSPIANVTKVGSTATITITDSNGTTTASVSDGTTPTLAPVATSGSYNDLTDKPTIPTKTSQLTNNGSDNTSTYVEADELATVATSGSYNDLTNKPTIPAAQVNSDWNASSGVAQILNKPTIPTKTSDLNNDSGFITSSSLPTKTSDLINDGSDNTSTYLEADETAYRTTSIPYGVCDGTSTSTVFTATVPGITELRDGVCMWLKNGVVTSASGFTININSLGAKPVYSNMAAATADTTLFNINYTMFFVYDSTRVAGGCWVLYRGYDSNTNTIGYQLRTNSQTMPMTSVVYRYRLLFTSADGEHYVPANNSTSTNATSSRTVCQDKIDPFGSILYYGTTASVAAGSRPAAASLWQQYTLALGYSFATGSALTMTSWKPVYLKCAPQTDGSAIIDSTTPYVQDLPTTEDGKIYIFLGIAYSATNIELQLNHPVYEFKGGTIRPYTNQVAGVSSFNGSTGDITYTAPVQSVNGATGAITGLQTTANLVTSVSSTSTDSQYPSAKLLYDTIGNVETILQTLNNGGGAQ